MHNVLLKLLRFNLQSYNYQQVFQPVEQQVQKVVHWQEKQAQFCLESSQTVPGYKIQETLKI